MIHTRTTLTCFGAFLGIPASIQMSLSFQFINRLMQMRGAFLSLSDLVNIAFFNSGPSLSKTDAHSAHHN